MNVLNKLKKSFEKFDIDGYLVPKNDEYFSEHAYPNRLEIISNFKGSAGIALILKKKIFWY